MGRLLISLLLATAIGAHAATYDWTNTPNATAYAPGDTVRLWGTFTNAVTITNSGTAGNPIIFQFQGGAKLSQAHWNGGNKAAIYATDKSYITIDGGTDGVIEATDNGTTNTTQLDCAGVDVENGYDIEIKNLKVQNLYRRTAFSASDANRITQGIVVNCYSNVSIHGCTTIDAGVGIYATFLGANAVGFNIYSNTCSRHYVGIRLASAGAGCVLTEGSIYANDISDTYVWTGNAAIHCDYIQTYGGGVGSGLYNAKIYRNYFHGTAGISANVTAIIYGEITSNVWVFNNVSDIVTNGFTSYWKDSKDMKVMNNTFYAGSTNCGGIPMLIGGSGTNALFQNNLVIGSWAITQSTLSTNVIAGFDYNVYVRPDCSALYFWGESGSYAWTDWQAIGFDSHSSTNQPTMSVYAPTSEDTVARDKGVNLSSYFTTDYTGATRTGAWDIGAYEFPHNGVVIQGKAVMRGKITF